MNSIPAVFEHDIITQEATTPTVDFQSVCLLCPARGFVIFADCL